LSAQENFGGSAAFLLGAGASREAGLPLSRDITGRVILRVPLHEIATEHVVALVAAVVVHVRPLLPELVATVAGGMRRADLEIVECRQD
jgi:hypothetical protein